VIDKQIVSHPDQVYIDGLVSGDKEVIASIYKEFYPMIDRYVKQNKGQSSDTKDLFSTALKIIFLQAKDGLKIQQSFGAYLRLICKRRWLNILNRRKRMVLDLDNQPEPSVAPDVVKRIEESERKLLFRKHFEKLPERCRQILESTFRGKNYRETAEDLKLNYNFVRRRGKECSELLMENIHLDPLFKELK